MQQTPNTYSAYTIIIALFIMSFLLILTTGVFRLILGELHQNRGSESYLKAFAGAQSGRELALLHIKKNGYGSYDMIPHSVNPRSVILSKAPNNHHAFELHNDVYISYDLGYRGQVYQGNLEKFGYDIIPLYSDDISVRDIELTVLGGDQNTLVWNIIGDTQALAGVGSFDNTTSAFGRQLRGSNIDITQKTVSDILRQSELNYLILFSSGDTDLQYRVEVGVGQYLTFPRTSIISSGQISKYRQNLQTQLDNTEFLGILKYSVLSPDFPR